MFVAFHKIGGKDRVHYKSYQREAPRVIIRVTGRYCIKFPTIPGQNNRGIKGPKVVKVPASTGTKLPLRPILRLFLFLNPGVYATSGGCFR